MKLLIVDAMNLIRRIYAAAPEGDLQIEATQARCMTAIARNAEQFQATHVVMVFEQKCQTWRHQMWPDYKLNRPPMPEALAQQLDSDTANRKAAKQLTQHWQTALLTRILAALRLDVPLGINLSDLRWQVSQALSS